MRILVISDTHVVNGSPKLPNKVLNEAKTSDLCIHAGDFVEKSVFDELSKLTKVIGVCGNMDERGIDLKLPLKRVLEIEGVKIGLTHGRGSAQNIIYTVQDIFVDEFSDLDMLVFGHSHLACNKIIDGKIYFNPGSPTDKIFAPYRSFGLLMVKDKKIDRRIVKIG